MEIRELNGGGDWGKFTSCKHFLFVSPHFPTEERFRENPGTSLEEKKVETKILPRYSLGARVVPSSSTQIGELSFTTRRILPFYKA